MLACVSLILMLGACATSSTGTAVSALGFKSKSPQTLQQAPAQSDALVVIRFPAAVDQLARNQYYQAFKDRPIGGELDEDVVQTDSDQVADSVIAKTNYYAMSLYKELSDSLPDNTVLLSPHLIELGADDKTLVSVPISSAENVPGIITVDFTAYSFPDAEQLFGKKPITFGNFMSPLLVLKADYPAMVPTNGLILASEPLLGAAYAQATQSMQNPIKPLAVQSGKSSSNTHSFVAYLNGLDRPPAAVAKLNDTFPGNATQVYKLEKIKFSKDDMLAIDEDPQVHLDPAKNGFSSRLAQRIIQALNNVNMQKASMLNTAKALSRYDSNLAPFVLSAETNPDTYRQIRMGKQMLAKEKEILSAQSERLYQAYFHGEFGKNMRKMIHEEYKLLNEYRKVLSEIRGASSAIGLEEMRIRSDDFIRCTVVYITQKVKNPTTGKVETVRVPQRKCYRDYAAEQRAMQRLAYLRRAYTVIMAELHAHAKSINRNFRLAMAPVLSQQINVQVDLLDGAEEISAASYAELQRKMQHVYKEHVRRTDQVASQCRIAGQDGTSGRWHGECRGGQANGRGSATLTRADGTQAQYFGQALAGQAHGIGYMIVHDKTDPYAIEGQFVKGQPNGPCLVSKAGMPDMVRMFENGQDMGPAPGQTAPRLFGRNNAPAQIN